MASAGWNGALLTACRRKYRKIMVTFEEKMRESTSLFRDEQRIFDISQRLAEQTEYDDPLSMAMAFCQKSRPC